MILTTDFHLRNARNCLELSDWVYGHTCDLVSPLCHAHLFEVPAVGPLLPGWMADGKEQLAQGTARVLAFRGSACIQDWITDAEFARTAIGAGEEVHHGFLDAIMSLNEQLKVIARSDGEYCGPLFIAGHSLGGAMALLAAKMLAELGCFVQAVYTFGGPRVGNGTWARNYDAVVGGYLGERTWRVVNGEDVVPRVPLLPVLTWSGLKKAAHRPWQTVKTLGYRHAGREVFLPAVGAIRIDPPLALKIVSDAVGTWWDWKRGRIAQLADHRILSYVARLQEAQPVAEGLQEAIGQ